MDSVKICVLKNTKGDLTSLTFGGLLVVENSQKIKDELVGLVDSVASSVLITIEDVEDIDLTFIQLLVAFQKKLTEKKTEFSVNWNLDDDQRILFKNVGLGDELLMND